MMNDIPIDVKRNAYSTDASGLLGIASEVLLPRSIEELKLAVQSNEKITIRGGGTGVVGGAVPNGSVVVDVSRLDRILDIDYDRRTVTVEAGIILQDLNDELEKYGLEFPIDPLSRSVCTIGGMIATNASGPRSSKYKRMTDWVLEVTIIDGLGNDRRISLVDASNIVGMEGITGIIYSAKLRVILKPLRTLTVYRSVDLFKIVELSRKLKLSDDVSMIYLISPLMSQVMNLDKIYHLFVEFESNQGDLKGELYNNKIRLINDIPSFSANAGYSLIDDPRVFLERLPDLSEFLNSSQVPFHANLGIGLVHPLFKIGDNEKVLDVRRFVRRIRGNVSGTFGLGRLKKDFMDVNDKKLVQRIKKRYDPLNKLNSDVIVSLDERLETPAKESVAEMIAEIDRQNLEKEGS